MITFFKKRPGVVLLLVTALFTSGALLAHRSGRSEPAPGRRLASLTGTKNKVARPAGDPLWWRDRLDLDLAREVQGKMVQQLADGTTATYTLDPSLQQWARELLRSNEVPYGAMVMVEVRTGRVLVMAAHSEKSLEVDTEKICLTPWAPAASVFKLVTATALLTSGVPASTKVCYHGGLRGLKRQHIQDNPDLDTTCASLAQAVAKSINPIVGKLAVRYLDQHSLARCARRFGFNHALPFDLPVQQSKADIPADDLALAQVAAGFWRTEISPLHGALIASVAAESGLLRWPHVVASIRDKKGQVFLPSPPEPRRVMGRSTAAELSRMMALTTLIGTGRRGFVNRRGRALLPKIQVAGKTGSLARKDPFLHYNWFVGFAPVTDPRVAFAVLLGNPARWRIKASTASRMLLVQYFAGKKKQSPDLARQRPLLLRILASKH